MINGRSIFRFNELQQRVLMYNYTRCIDIYTFRVNSLDAGHYVNSAMVICGSILWIAKLSNRARRSGFLDAFQ